MRLNYKILIDFIQPIRTTGDFKFEITGVAPLNRAKPNQIAFCSLKGEKAINAILDSNAGIIICYDDLPEIQDALNNKCIVTVENPRLSFVRCLQQFFTPDIEWGVHSTAVIEKDVFIPPNVYIGPMVYIGHGVKIGEGCIIEHRVHIASDSEIGKNVYLQTGAVVGCKGQGFERNEQGQFERFPQVGCVVIEDDVEVGANSTIVRGALFETRIGTGSKIGHLSDIGHNVQIGEHVFISAGVVVCGSAIIGDFTWLAPKCCVKNKVEVGRYVTVGLGAVVTRDIEDNLTVIGVPAKPIWK